MASTVLLVLPFAEGARAAPHASAGSKSFRCLTEVLFWEAKDDGRDGMVAVAWVVLNRVRNPEFPKTICGVAGQRDKNGTCQFSYWCDGRQRATAKDATRWQLAKRVARQMLTNPPPDPTHGALYFHANNIRAPWKRTRIAKIGTHVYYR